MLLKSVFFLVWGVIWDQSALKQFVGNYFPTKVKGGRSPGSPGVGGYMRGVGWSLQRKYMNCLTVFYSDVFGSLEDMYQLLNCVYMDSRALRNRVYESLRCGCTDLLKCR
jgi:hypothetical protein